MFENYFGYNVFMLQIVIIKLLFSKKNINKMIFEVSLRNGSVERFDTYEEAEDFIEESGNKNLKIRGIEGWNGYRREKNGDFITTYYLNGNVMEEGSIRNGKCEGPWVFYYPSGKIESEGNFENGRRVGTWINRYPSQQIESTATFRNS